MAMKKIVSLLYLLFFSSLIFAQLDVITQAELEEHGKATEIRPPNELHTDSAQWAPLQPASTAFGRTVNGVVGEYLYIFSSQGATSLAIAMHLPTRTWVQSTPPGSPGYNAASCVANGEIYKLSGSGSVNVFEKFTPTSNGLGTWTTLTAGPSNIMNAQNAIAYDGSRYIYAYNADYNTPTSSYLARYEISAGTWESLTGSPHPKRYPGMVGIDGKIYIIGGLVPSGVDPQVCQVYDPATKGWSTIAPIPEAINFAKWSTTTDGRFIYLLGSGGGYSTYPASTNIYYYNPQTNTWGNDGNTPAERGLAVGIFLTGFNKVFFGGGNSGGSGTNYQVDCWEGDSHIFIPVELTSFTASISGSKVGLSWTTATEKNNNYFEVERSSDKIKFTSIGRISGNGNSVISSSYNFTDNTPPSGLLYYRLKQVDFSGGFEYSSIVEVSLEIPVIFAVKQNYPNPFNPSTKISFSLPMAEKVSIKIFDALGREVSVLADDYHEAGNFEIPFIAADLPSGIYFCKIVAGEHAKTIKMVLMK
jgi:hypothetical protein